MTSVEPQGPDPLAPILSDRGFRHMPTIEGKRSSVTVYDSSAADEPRIWVKVHEQDHKPHSFRPSEAHAHLTIAEATLLRDQLTRLIEGDL